MWNLLTMWKNKGCEYGYNPLYYSVLMAYCGVSDGKVLGKLRLFRYAYCIAAPTHRPNWPGGLAEGF